METELFNDRGELATRADLVELRHAFELKIEQLRTEMNAKFDGLRGELVRWVFVAMLGQTPAVLGACCFFLSKFPL